MAAIPRTDGALGEILEEIAVDDGLASLRRRVEADMERDAAHDLGHLLRVARWTLEIGGTEVDRREAIAAALCHDLINLPKTSERRAEASTLSADAARRMLPECGFVEEAVERIANAVRDHSFSRGAVPTSPLGRALQDADRLETLGAIGLIRVFATGARMEALALDPIDPWAKRRPLDDQAFTIDHFFTKLLRLPESLLTAAGRAEARRRAELLEDFLEALEIELGESRSDAEPARK